MVESWVDQYAEFSVRARQRDPDFSADFDPARITETLGMEPTRSARRDEDPEFGEPTMFSTWSWATSRRAEFRTEDVLLEVLEELEPRSAALALAADRFDVDYRIQVVAEMHGYVETSSEGTPDFLVATPAVVLRPSTLTRLAALNLALVLTYEVYPDARELLPIDDAADS